MYLHTYIHIYIGIRSRHYRQSRWQKKNVSTRAPAPCGPPRGGGLHRGGQGGGLLRIAYLSSDFGDHTTGVNIGGIFKEHDSSRVKVFGYATSEDDGSAVRQRIERECHLFRDLHELRCVYVLYYVYTYFYACTYTYTYTYTYILVHAHAYIHGHTHIYIYIHA